VFLVTLSSIAYIPRLSENPKSLSISRSISVPGVFDRGKLASDFRVAFRLPRAPVTYDIDACTSMVPVRFEDLITWTKTKPVTATT
jgi:hypothetical protein